MQSDPYSIGNLAACVDAQTKIIEGIKPALDHMAEALARWEVERENLRAELYASRARADEMAQCCLYLVEAVRESRMGEARAMLELEHLRTIVDEAELRRTRADRETPPEGIRVPWVDE